MAAQVPANSAEQAAPGPPRKRSWLRRLAWGLGVLVALVLLLVLVAVLALQTEWGRSQVQEIATTQIQNLLADDATVEIGRLDGPFVAGATLTDLVIRRGDERVLSVDSVQARYNLAALLGKRLALSEVVVVGPFVRLAQQADSSFDVATLFVTDTTATDTTGGNFAVSLDDLRVERGRVEVAFFTGPDAEDLDTEDLDAEGQGRDSLLTVDPLGLRLTGFAFGPDQLEGTLDRAAATLTAADRTTALDLGLAGRFDAETAALDTLRLTSPRTDVRGGLSVEYAAFLEALAEADADTPLETWLPRFAADLRAQPLSMADVRAFAPVAVTGAPTLTLDASSDGRNLTAVLDADLNEAGTADLTATFRTPTSGRVVYRAAGQLRDFDPGRLFGNPDLVATLNADLDVDLAGASHAALDGPVVLRVFDASVNGQPIESSTLDGQFASGQMRFGLDAVIPGAALTASGQARPFAATPTYFAEGRFFDVDLAAFADSVSGTPLSGTISLAGQGFEPDAMQASLGVTLDPAAVRTAATTTQIEEVALDAQLRRRTVRFDLRGLFGPTGNAGGALALQGLAQPFATPLTYEITEGTAQRLDLAALTGDPEQASSITGTFTLDGRGTDPQTLALDLQAALDDTRYGTTRIPSADLFAGLADGLLAFDGEVDLADAGRVEARGEVTPFADTLRYQLDALLTNLDAGAFAAPEANPDTSATADTTAFMTRLNGTLRLDGSGTDPQALDLTGRVVLTESQVNQQQIESGAVALRLGGGTLDVDGTVTTPEGLVRLDATGRPFDATPAVTVREGRFENLDVGAFAGNPRLASSLTGRFNADYTGKNLETGTLQGVLRFDPSTLSGADLDGTLSFALDDGLGQGNADLALAGGTVRLDADLTLPGTDESDTVDSLPRFDAAGSIDSVALGPFLAPLLTLLPDSVRRANPELANRDLLTLSFDVTGVGRDLGTLQARGRAESPGSTLLGLRVDSLYTAFTFAEQRLDMQTLTVLSEVVDLRAGGEVAFDNITATSSLFTFTGQLKNTALLSALAGQPVLLEGGRVEGEVSSEPGEPMRFRVDANTDLFALGTVRASDLGVDALGLYSRAEGIAARFRFESGYLSAGTFRAREIDADARYDGDDLALDVTLEIDDGRSLRVKGEADLDPFEPQLTLASFDMRLGRRAFALAAPARITYGERIRVRNFLLAADTPGLGVEQIAADGVIDLAGRQNFILTIEGLALNGLTDLAGLDALGGRLDASLVLGGTASAPRLDGTFAVEPITSRGREVGTIDATFAYADARFDLDAALAHADGAQLRAEGFVPFGFALDGTPAQPPPDAPVDVRLTTTEPFPIAWATPFFDPRTLNELGGTLTADAAVVGTRANPQLDGQALLADGRMGLPEFGRVYENATIPLTFDGDRLTLGSDSLGAASLRDAAGGTLTADGALLVPDLQFAALDLDLTVQADRYLGIDNDTYAAFRVSATGQQALRITGPVDGPSIAGTVTIDQGTANQTEELIGPTFGEIALTTADIQRVEATFGVRATAADTTVSAIYVNTDIDLRVIIPGRVRYRAEGFANIDLEFEGDLLVRKERGQDEVQLFDSIEIPRGTVEFGGRRFDVTRGVFVFNGPVTETRVDLEADMVIRQTGQATTSDALTITLDYAGTLGENPAPSFSSSPVQLETSDIVCYIATGQPCAGIVAGAGDTGMGLVASQLSAAIGNVAGQSLGLDLVQIEARPEITVTIGKYLTNRLFATLGYLVSQNTDAVDAATLDLVLQYQLRQWLQLQGEYEQLQDGENNVGGGVQFEVAY